MNSGMESKMTMEINHQHSNVMEMKTDAGVDTSDKMMRSNCVHR